LIKSRGKSRAESREPRDGFSIRIQKSTRNAARRARTGLSINNQQSTINNQQSTINNQQSTINNQQSTISNQQSAISNQQSAISNQQSAISNQQSAISPQGEIPPALRRPPPLQSPSSRYPSFYDPGLRHLSGMA